MKNILFYVLTALAGFGFSFVALNSFTKADSGEKNKTAFNVPEKQLTKDLNDRWVSLGPHGQLWGFTPDQKVALTVLQIKGVEDGVVVSARLKTAATFQTEAPNQKSKEKEPTTKQVTVQMDGVAKLYYELIAGEWYLAQVESITLKALQK